MMVFFNGGVVDTDSWEVREESYDQGWIWELNIEGIDK
jgi:hypothetical protein